MFGIRFQLPTLIPFLISPSIGGRKGYHAPPFGTSKRTVARDRRAATKRRAVKRARKLGQA